MSGDSRLADRVVAPPLCPVDLKHGGPRPASAITKVVIHTILGTYDSAIAGWMSGKGQGCFKPHYAVRVDGNEVTQVMPELTKAIHANGENANSIGIEHDGHADDPRHYTEAMYARSAMLVRDICLRHKIPMDRTGVIGHEEALRATHMDPGGYWDWDYFMALVNWDENPVKRPIRVIGANDPKNPDVTTPWRTGGAWREVPRAPTIVNAEVPHQHHSWSPRWLRANPLPFGSPDADAAAMVLSAPRAGNWEVSLWWPTLPTNNFSVGVTVSTGIDKTTEFTRRIDQAAKFGRARNTTLRDSPTWFSLGTVTLDAPGPVWVDVSRVSPLSGHIAVDAVRLLRR